jgi:hypothetical protein
MAAKKIKKKYPPRVKKPITADDMLKLIRSFMERGDGNEDEQRKLWNVMSALRGPDNRVGNYGEKTISTAVLRYKVFGENSAVVRYADMFQDSPEYRQKRCAMETANDHFGHHVKLGFESAGLKWDEVNL